MGKREGQKEEVRKQMRKEAKGKWERVEETRKEK